MWNWIGTYESEKNVLKIHTEVKIKKFRYSSDDYLVILQLQHETEK
jgi:hypothetical protein